MGILSSLFGARGSDEPIGVSVPVRIDGDGTYAHECVGESNYTASLRALAGAGRTGERNNAREVEVYVMLEPTNAYDPRAVVVRTTDGETLGYLPRNSPLYEPIRDAGGAINVMANIRGRYDDDDGWRLGIWLDIA